MRLYDNISAIQQTHLPFRYSPLIICPLAEASNSYASEIVSSPVVIISMHPSDESEIVISLFGSMAPFPVWPVPKIIHQTHTLDSSSTPASIADNLLSCSIGQIFLCFLDFCILHRLLRKTHPPEYSTSASSEAASSDSTAASASASS